MLELIQELHGFKHMTDEQANLIINNLRQYCQHLSDWKCRIRNLGRKDQIMSTVEQLQAKLAISSDAEVDREVSSVTSLEQETAEV